MAATKVALITEVNIVTMTDEASCVKERLVAAAIAASCEAGNSVVPVITADIPARTNAKMKS